MDKEEISLRGNVKEYDDDVTMRKSFRGVIDETEEEIMTSFASLILKSDEFMRITMVGSSGKFCHDFDDDDISSCYEEFEDDNEENNNYLFRTLNNNNNTGPFLLPTHVKFEPEHNHPAKKIVQGSPKQAAPTCQPGFQSPSGMVSMSASNTPILVPSTSASPKKETHTTLTTNDNVKPKRPLSAYNLYFQLERERLIAGVEPGEPFNADDVERIAIQRRELEQNPSRPKRKHRKSHGKISFAELARKIADKWKCLTPEAKDLLQERAAIEKTRYLRELEVWTKYNNTSTEGIYSPKATISDTTAHCPKTTPVAINATSNYNNMPTQFIAPLRQADYAEQPIFHHRYSYPGSPLPQQMHHEPVPAFHAPSQPHWMNPPYQHHYHYNNNHHHHHPHGQFPPPFFQQPQQQQQEQQRYQPFLEEHIPYDPRYPLVSPSASFDSSFEPQDLTSDASALAERYGWSTSSVLDMMRELDGKWRQRSSPNSDDDDDDEDDHVPRGALDEARFTPI